MKKILLTLAAVVMAAGFVNAQDLATATETYNNAAELLSMGKKADALASFQEALKAGEALGDEASELVANCKSVIPDLTLSIGKELYNKKDFDGALAKINEAVAVAKEYGNNEVADEAASLVPVITSGKVLTAGTEALNAKNYAAAAESFKSVLEADPSNAVAALRLVQCYTSLDDMDKAKEALAVAEQNGQGENAKKVLGSALLKKAAASLKAGKNADAMAQASESAEYVQNAQAYLVAGQAATKLQKNAEAIKYYEQYLEAAPTAKNAGAITFTVAALYQQAGNKAKALENYKKILTDATYGAQAKAQVDALSK